MDEHSIAFVQEFFKTGKPAAFCAKVVEEFAEGTHDVAPEGATA